MITFFIVISDWYLEVRFYLQNIGICAMATKVFRFPALFISYCIGGLGILLSEVLWSVGKQYYEDVYMFIILKILYSIPVCDYKSGKGFLVLSQTGYWQTILFMANIFGMDLFLFFAYDAFILFSVLDRKHFAI